MNSAMGTGVGRLKISGAGEWGNFGGGVGDVVLVPFDPVGIPRYSISFNLIIKLLNVILL